MRHTRAVCAVVVTSLSEICSRQSDRLWSL